jgi:aspartate aminotransferase
MALLARRIDTLGTENAFSLGVDIQRVVDRGMDVVRLNIGEPDVDSPPHINRVGAEQILAGNSHYTDPQGIPALRRAIASHVTRSRGVEVDPERVVVTAGAKPSIGFTMLTYVDPGDEVIYPSPGFPIYESWVTFVGATPRPLHLSEERGFAFTADDLAALVTDRTKVIVLNSPSNPTGGVLSEGDLRGIADVVRRRCGRHVRIYSDEIYEHTLFDGRGHRSIITEDGMADRTILMSGHSKGFAMTGWRLGWVILPSVEEAAVFTRLNINTVSCVPPFIQEAGRTAYESPESISTTGDMVRAFEERRDQVVPALNEIDGIRCQIPKGAFYVFPNVADTCERLGILSAWDALPEDVRTRTSPSAMLQMFLLYRYGVATMDRNSFGVIGAEGQHFLRLSIAAGLARLLEGVERFAEAARDSDGFRSFMDEERLWEAPAV